MSRNFNLYTSACNLKHYLQHDFISCRKTIEAPTHYGTISNSIDFGVVLTDKAISPNDIKFETQDTSCVCSLCVRLPDDTDILAIGKDLVNAIKVSAYDDNIYDFVFVRGYIPLSCVTNVVFENETDKEGSYIDMFSCVYYPKELYITDKDCFKNGIRFSDETISLIVNSDHYLNLKYSANDIIKTIKHRNKVKAVFLASLDNFSVEWGYIYESNVDKTIIHDIIGVTDAEVISNTGINLNINFPSEDTTCFKKIKTILSNIASKKPSVPINYDEFKSKNRSEYCETVIFAELLDKLFQIDYATYNNVSVLEEFNKGVLKYLDSYEAQDFKKGVRLISEIIRNEKNIIELLSKKKESQLSSMRAALVLLKNSTIDPEGFKNEISSISLDTYQKRLLWAFYGALQGMSGLHKKNKANRHMILFCEKLTEEIVPCEDLITVREIQPPVVEYRHCLIKSYPVKIKENIDRLRQKLIDFYENGEKRKSYLESLLLSNIEIPDQYFSTKIMASNFIKVQQDGIMVTILLKGRQKIECEYCFDLEKYKHEILENSVNFKNEFDKQPNKWKSLMLTLSKNE